MKIEKFDETVLKSSEDKVISFDESLKTEEICDIISKTIAYENENNIHYSFNLKNLDTEKISGVLRFVMNDENVNNPSLIFNIILLLKTYNSLDDSFFQNENVYFNSLEDFLDIKSELKQDIRKFNTRLSVYFISCLKSLNKFEYSFIDNPEDVPETFKNVLMSIDIFTVSGILSNNNGYTDKDMKLIRNAYSYVSEIVSKMNMVDRFFNMFNNSNCEQIDGEENK